jgi:mono/diheme cytochrome c family protein
MITRRLRIALALPCTLALAVPLTGPLAADPPAPQAAAAPGGTDALHQEHCIKCHGSEVYTRADRKVTSLAGLGSQVRQCETALSLRWFDEDIDEMTAFLNERFYHFKPGS